MLPSAGDFLFPINNSYGKTHEKMHMINHSEQKIIVIINSLIIINHKFGSNRMLWDQFVLSMDYAFER